MNLPINKLFPRRVQLILIHLDKELIGYHLYLVSQKEKTPIYSGNSLDELIHKLSSKYPVALHIQGQGVLTRVMELVPNHMDILLVGGNKQDFYINQLNTGASVAVSFIRKKSVHELIELLVEKQFSIQHLLVGSLICVEGSVNSYSINSEIHLKTLPSGEFELSKPPREFSAETLREHVIEGFRTNILLKKGTVFNFVQGISAEEFTSREKGFKDARTFKILGLSILIFFLVSLTGNYFYVNYLNQHVATKEAELSVYGQNMLLITRLEQEQQRKLALINTSGLVQHQFISYFMDQTGKSVPADIQLNSMEIYPLVDQLKPKERVTTDPENILIEGLSQNSMVLDKWIFKLETFSWIKSVEVINFTRINQSKSSFIISVHLNT